MSTRLEQSRSRRVAARPRESHCCHKSCCHRLCEGGTEWIVARKARSCEHCCPSVSRQQEADLAFVDGLKLVIDSSAASAFWRQRHAESPGSAHPTRERGGLV